MAVVAHVVLEGVSPEQYDNLRTATGWLEHAPDGGLLHMTWWEGATCHNMDAWESEASMMAFANDRLGPAMAQIGLAVEPQITFHPAHEVFMPKAATLI